MTADSPRATRREWLGLAVIALPCLLYSMDLTVLYLAVPSLSADLEPTGAQLLWITDIYGFLLAGLLITMGTLGDRIGRRRLLLIGAAAFGVVSVLAAFATSAEMLIAARAVLGIAGATLAPSTLSLIRNMFLDPRQRTVAIGVWITSFSAGGAVGPLVGGALLEHFWWGSVFLVGVPVMVLLIVLAVIFGLKRIAEDGSGWLPALSILAGLAAGVVFVRRQRALADPLIDLRLFRVPAFSASLAVYALGTFVAFGSFLLIAQHLQLVLGMGPFEAGLWTAPFAGGFIVGSMLTPVIVRRVRPAFVMGAGLALAAVGFGLLTQIDRISGLAVVVTGFVVFSLGLAPVFTLATDMIVGTAPPERAGAASAISETGSELGGALGIAILGSIGTAVYRGAMADAVPDGVSPEAADAARETLGGATTVAAHLPDQLAAALIDTARGAFADGLRVTAATSALIVTALAIVAVVLLRRVGAGAAPEGLSTSPPGRRTSGDRGRYTGRIVQETVMKDEALTQALSRALLALRITLGLFLLQWGLEKFVVPQSTVAIWGYFYGLNVPQALAYVFGAVEIAIAGCLFLGRFRTVAYGAALALHAVTVLVTWRQLLDPWGDPVNHLFIAGVPVLGALIALFLLRHWDR